MTRLCEICGTDISHKKASALACSVECNHARLVARRKAEKWEGVDPERPCETCGASMEGKRPHARFCSRPCKAKASNARLRDTGVLRERDRARYAKEAERRKEYARRYLRENPERMRAIRRNRKSKIKAARFLVTTRDWDRLVARHRGCCAYCGRRSDILHREHVIPIAKGGRHSIGNLLPACPPCNYAKKTKLLIEFRRDRGLGVITTP